MSEVSVDGRANEQVLHRWQSVTKKRSQKANKNTRQDKSNCQWSPPYSEALSDPV